MVDPERLHVDELEPIALGEPPCLLDFRGAVAARLGVGVERNGCVSVSHQDVVRTELNWKSGMYSASRSAAMTMPMITSSSGSMSVTNRSMLVEISSS